MNQDEHLKLRQARLAQWRVIAVGKFGLVNQATAAWLLDVSHQRVGYLLQAGKIEFVKWDGLAMIPFLSVAKYATRNKRLRPPG